MSNYGSDYDQRGRRGRDHHPPPPAYDDYGANGRRPAHTPYEQQGKNYPPPPRGPPPGESEFPPPPMGEALPSAMRREGSRSRVPHLRPEFPEEPSYLGGKAPDLESKNRPAHRHFRDKRDGYESEEGEALRKSKPGRSGPRPDADDYYDDEPRRRRRPRDEYDSRDPPRDSRGPPSDDRGPPRSSTWQDDRPPPRRRRDRDRRDDDDYDDPPRRRGGRPQDIEYGSDPVQVRRRHSERAPQRPRPSRRGDYDEDSDSGEDRRRPPPRRRQSQDDHDRRRRDRYDDDRDSDRRRRPERSRRRNDDDYSDDDRHDRRDRNRRSRSGPPKEMKIGGFDVGPLVAKGQKHYGTLAPIVTPLVMNMAKKYLTK